MNRARPYVPFELLFLHRHLTDEHVVAGLAAALRAGALTADAVALQARMSADGEDNYEPVNPPHPLPSNVIWLARRRPPQLPADTRPPPSVDIYDQLLHHRNPTTAR